MSARRLAGPHRLVDWRDQIAKDLVAEDRAPVPGHHDSDVTMLAHFYRRRRDCRTMHDHDRLARAMPHVFSAVQMREQASTGVRTVVDALVLANQPLELIAARARVTKESIECFEAMFFDVRGRLGDSQFILESVIRLQEVDANSEDFASAVVKLLSYYTGPTSIDLLTMPRGDQWVSIREVASKLARRARILLHLTPNGNGSSAEVRRNQEILRVIEEYPGQYGDEAILRTEEQVTEARKQVLDKLLMDQIRGGRPANGEGGDVQ